MTSSMPDVGSVAAKTHMWAWMQPPRPSARRGLRRPTGLHLQHLTGRRGPRSGLDPIHEFVRNRRRAGPRGQSSQFICERDGVSPKRRRLHQVRPSTAVRKPSSSPVSPERRISGRDEGRRPPRDRRSPRSHPGCRCGPAGRWPRRRRRSSSYARAAGFRPARRNDAATRPKVRAAAASNGSGSKSASACWTCA